MTIGKQDIIIIGLDTDKKPRAAKFDLADSDAVRRAAQLMNLRVATGKSDEQKAVIAKLSDGKIFASGKGLVPLIRKAMYDVLLNKLDLEPETEGAVAPKHSETPQKQPLPQAWQDLRVGSTVIAPEANTSSDGWWPCAVTAVKGEQLTLRWIDNPKQKPVTMHRSAVAILAPSNAK